METLPLFHRLAGRPVLLVGDGDGLEQRRRLLEQAGATPVPDAEAENARLAFVAGVADPEAVAAGLRARGFLVNVADRPDLCDFFVPAIVDRSPVVLAVGTAGASASLARALRERLEAWAPAGLGALAGAIRIARDNAAGRIPGAAERRRFWAAALAPGAVLDPLADHPDASAAVARALERTNSAAPRVRHVRIPPGPFAEEELSLAAIRAISSADTVIHDADVPAAVLAFARRDARMMVGPALPEDAAGQVVRVSVDHQQERRRP
jgi:uroporphyrin-III C-methyltransferase/precorrin-2 dehydrogenase/sirohydrochlorin ferrochelatase